nr:helix-turn-helix transcriptional regulator [uncultured Acetatifactor sp.]
MTRVTVTKNLAKYVKDMGINLSDLSRKSGVAYSALYASLGGEGRGRELRANELTDICFTLRINPMDFAEKEQEVETRLRE